MNYTPDMYVGNIEYLEALPDICLQIDELIENPYSSALEIAELISRDPSLSTQLLRIANSPFYGFPSRIDTIDRAVAVIGTRDIKDLVTCVAIINKNSSIPNDYFNLQAFWKHGVFVGMIARNLAKKATVKILHKERLFLAGLLHDIGHLVLSTKSPDLFGIMVNRNLAEKHEDFTVSQNIIFDMNSMDVGAALLRKWKLPTSFQTIVKNRNQIEKLKVDRLETAIIHIANVEAGKAGLSGSVVYEDDSINAAALETTGLSSAQIQEVVEQTSDEFKSTINAFVGTPRGENAKLKKQARVVAT